MKLLIINGPNLNMLGIREPDIYGKEDYQALCDHCEEICKSLGVTCDIVQSNHEGELVDAIQGALGAFDGILINPAAYTHTSIAILDALKAVGLPAVEVHLSKVDEREDFRRLSYAGMGCEKTITGLGFEGYSDAIRYLVDRYDNNKE